MNKALVLALALLLAAVGIAFYVGPQRAILLTVHKLVTLKKEYLEDNSTGLSAGARAFEAMLRAMPPKGDTLQDLRNTMDDFQHFVPLPSTTTVEAVRINANLQGYWVTPAESKEDDGGRVVFYLHGGGFVAGSSVGYLGWVSEIASRIKGRGFFVEYRLAPESPLPIAVEDSIAAYRYVTETKKVDPKKLVVMGDSAGGGLTLLTLLSLQENKLPVPAAAVTFSAWTDYYGSADMANSYTSKAQSDAMLNSVILKDMALLATGTKEEEFDKRKSPKVSPLYADLKKVRFPPLLMEVGDTEVLLDDTLRFYGKALQAKLDVTLEQAKGMQHIYPFFYQFMVEAEQGLQQAVDFALKHFA